MKKQPQQQQQPPLRSLSGGSSVYSPEVAQMDSPVEGGFEMKGESSSSAVLKRHVKELYALLSKAEEDKQKIADEAYTWAEGCIEYTVMVHTVQLLIPLPFRHDLN